MTLSSSGSDEVLLSVARLWHDAGFCVVPSHEDGRKRPMGAWRQYQQCRPAWEQIEEWIRSGLYTGIGVITGAASGHVEMIELEGPAELSSELVEILRDEAARLGLEELLRRFLGGCVEMSGGGGVHGFIRVCDGLALGNTKLASRDGKVVAETRGEGGFVIVAPTPARVGQPDGAVYHFVGDSRPADVTVVTSAERDQLHRLVAGALDQSPAEGRTGVSAAPAPRKTGSASAARDVDAPWVQWAAATSWGDILVPAGWTATHTTSDGRTHWVRPGKNPRDGASATTLDDGPMYVFSTSTELPALEGMSKQYAFAKLHHGGDLAAFGRHLAASGWGTPLLPPALTAWSPLDASAPSRESTSEDEADDAYERAVAAKHAELRVLDDARARLAVDQLGTVPPLEGINLTTFLDQPDPEVPYVIEGMWPSGGRVLMAAAAKAGKTTLTLCNVLPALVDGGLFLGRIPVTAFPGRIAVFNMEVPESTERRWLRDAAIVDTDAVVIVNLRGRAGALLMSTPQARRRLAKWMRDQGIALAIIDPLAPVLAVHGLDENSNTDVAKWFAWWSETCALAGVAHDLIVHHTGHAGDRSRGASRLLDEPDAVWTLTKDKPTAEEEEEFAGLTAVRHLGAFGRDVELPAEALDFDPVTRRLSLSGRNPHQARRELTSRRAEEAIVAFVAANDGATTRDIKYAAGVGRDFQAVLSGLVRDGRLDTSMGPRRTIHHHLPRDRRA